MLAEYMIFDIGYSVNKLNPRLEGKTGLLPVIEPFITSTVSSPGITAITFVGVGGFLPGCPSETREKPQLR
jgi:hypothetical protein